MARLEFHIRDETETRLNEKHRARPRPDQWQFFIRDRDETESLGPFSLETETRPRVSPISEEGLPLPAAEDSILIKCCKPTGLNTLKGYGRRIKDFRLSAA